MRDSIETLEIIYELVRGGCYPRGAELYNIQSGQIMHNYANNYGITLANKRMRFERRDVGDQTRG